MTITIDLLPEETTRLAAEARREGMSLAEYLHERILPGKAVEGVDFADDGPPRKRRITELEGLGKEIWRGVDARKYLDELRGEKE